MSLLYLLIGFGINKDNAKYLLAGYNTMNQEEQDKFDIEGYLNFLKPFFLPLNFALNFFLTLITLVNDFG